MSMNPRPMPDMSYSDCVVVFCYADHLVFDMADTWLCALEDK